MHKWERSRRVWIDRDLYRTNAACVRPALKWGLIAALMIGLWIGMAIGVAIESRL